MEENLLSKKELAARWGVNPKTIDRWVADGVISPCKKIPAIRFSPQHIAELEGVPLERFSPLLKRKMEGEIEELRRENVLLKQTLNNMVSAGLKVINYNT